MTKHVMIDIETWAKSPNAQIISIGAVKFNPHDPGGPWDNFHVAIDPSAWMPGEPFDTDPSTIMWWMGASNDEPRNHWLASKKLDMPTVLAGFVEWFGPESLPTWGNGATFDNVILLNALAKAGFDRPWSYSHDRCYRTLKNLYPHIRIEQSEADVVLGSDGGAHTALYDARWQALHMIRIFERGIIGPASALVAQPVTLDETGDDVLDLGEPGGSLPLAEEVREIPDELEAWRPPATIQTDEDARVATVYNDSGVHPQPAAPIVSQPGDPEYDRWHDIGRAVDVAGEKIAGMEERIKAEAPGVDEAITHRCPRRDEMFLTVGLGQEDTWLPGSMVRTCSYCGSLHPDDFMRCAEVGLRLGATDKNYKVYVDAPGKSHAKFYFQHLSQEQRNWFITLANDRQLNMGGYDFYVDPFFMQRKSRKD